MKATITRYNVLTEARKVLKGKPTKVSRELLLQAFAERVLEHNAKAKEA